MPYFIAFVIVVIVLFVAVVISRLYLVKAYNLIDETLDNVLTKRPISPLSKLGDDRISKLQHKAYRIIDMYVSDASAAQSEKQTIQGFISDMSHQMKTPLSGISMYSELLVNGNISDTEKNEFVGRIKCLSEKLEWMMECLIKMSRLEVGAIELSPKMCDVRKTLLAAVESIISGAARKNIDISLLPFADMELYHDHKWTVEVIVNILENAIKYSHSDSEITIEVEPLSLYTKISITDNGMGIEKEDFNLIFKRFYRGQNAKDNDGAGLGLYLATLIMEKQGGYIMVDSIVGKSTSFSLFLQSCKK